MIRSASSKHGSCAGVFREYVRASPPIRHWHTLPAPGRGNASPRREMRVLISLGVSCAEWYTSGLVFDARYVDRGDIAAAHQVAGVTRTASLIEQQRRAF